MFALKKKKKKGTIELVFILKHTKKTARKSSTYLNQTRTPKTSHVSIQDSKTFTPIPVFNGLT